MADLGEPTSYLELPEGVPVLTADGEAIGTVAHVLADADADIFDGVVIDTSRGPGGHRFADATQIDGLYTGGAVLTLDAAAAERLPEPTENPAAMEVSGEDLAERELDDELEAKLKRAWDRISGKRP